MTSKEILDVVYGSQTVTMDYLSFICLLLIVFLAVLVIVLCGVKCNKLKSSAIVIYCENEKDLEVLEILKEYQVDVWLLKQCDYKNYIRIRKEAMVSIGQISNEDGIAREDEITEELFNFLKEWIEE